MSDLPQEQPLPGLNQSATEVPQAPSANFTGNTTISLLDTVPPAVAQTMAAAMFELMTEAQRPISLGQAFFLLTTSKGFDRENAFKTAKIGIERLLVDKRIRAVYSGRTAYYEMVTGPIISR